MSVRGKAAIVGIGELPTKRDYPGRSSYSLCAEAAKLAIEDAGLRKEDIDGVITSGEQGHPVEFAEHIGLKPSFCQGSTLHGASGAGAVAMAAAAIAAGYANNVLCVFGGSRDPAAGGTQPGAQRITPPSSPRTEFENPYGPVIAANGGYALLKQRHMYEFGTTDEQFAKIAADQRFNAQSNPNAVFYGQPATREDVLASRMVSDPLHLLECVMPCGGALACIVTSEERAKSMRQPPAYILGVGVGATDHDVLWQSPRMTVTPVVISARKAYEMAGYGPNDIEFAEFYD